MFTSLTPTNSKILKYLLWTLMVPLGLSWLFLMGRFSRNEEKVTELRKLAAAAPVYPQSVVTKSTAQSNTNHASLRVTYYISGPIVTFDDLRLFYFRELRAKGWSPHPTRYDPVIDLGGDREGHITFRRERYWITVEPGGLTNEYDVTYRWE